MKAFNSLNANRLSDDTHDTDEHYLFGEPEVGLAFDESMLDKDFEILRQQIKRDSRIGMVLIISALLVVATSLYLLF